MLISMTIKLEIPRLLPLFSLNFLRFKSGVNDVEQGNEWRHGDQELFGNDLGKIESIGECC
jgi:hypothetical protein